MPRIVKTVVYELPELSASARERARAWYRDACLDWDWYDAVFEDFETVCGLLGVTLRTRTVRLMGGGTREAPNVWFHGYADDRNMPCSLPKALIARTVVREISA